MGEFGRDVSRRPEAARRHRQLMAESRRNASLAQPSDARRVADVPSAEFEGLRLEREADKLNGYDGSLDNMHPCRSKSGRTTTWTLARACTSASFMGSEVGTVMVLGTVRVAVVEVRSSAMRRNSPASGESRPRSALRRWGHEAALQQCIRAELEFDTQQLDTEERAFLSACGACAKCGPGASTSADQVTLSVIKRNFSARSGPGLGGPDPNGSDRLHDARG